MDCLLKATFKRDTYARRCGGNRCIRKAWLIHTGCVEDNTFGEIPIHSSLGTSIDTTWWTSRAKPSTIIQASYQWFGLDPIHVYTYNYLICMYTRLLGSISISLNQLLVCRAQGCIRCHGWRCAHRQRGGESPSNKLFLYRHQGKNHTKNSNFISFHLKIA